MQDRFLTAKEIRNRTISSVLKNEEVYFALKSIEEEIKAAANSGRNSVGIKSIKFNHPNEISKGIWCVLTSLGYKVSSRNNLDAAGMFVNFSLIIHW
jgi:hypothetical protein